VNPIFIGTSGYSYEDWKDFFYPSQISSKDYLSYYSNYFNTVELNFTYYSFPAIHVFDSMCARVKDLKEFVFSVKAHSIFTHQRNYCVEDAKKFLESLKPLSEHSHLGSILFQFPYSFHLTQNNLDYLSRIGEDFKGYEICMEFRNKYWLDTKVLSLLESLNIGFCNVDEPLLKGLLPATDICTSNIGYIRFHGRNSQSWWESENAFQRYDYMYKQEELAEWIPRMQNITEKSKKIFVYFNNHYKGKAAKSALMFAELLKS
jgi:uncharacterized protein YecE (DUF72 family)